MTGEACPICGAALNKAYGNPIVWECGRIDIPHEQFEQCPYAEDTIKRLRAEVEQWKTVSAAGVRPDIHAWMVRDRDRLRAQLDGVVAAVEGANRYRPVVMSARGAMISVEDGAWIKREDIIARIKGGGVTTSTVKTGKELCDACSRFENQVCTWGCDVLMEGEFCDDWGRAR